MAGGGRRGRGAAAWAAGAAAGLFAGVLALLAAVGLAGGRAVGVSVAGSGGLGGAAGPVVTGGGDGWGDIALLGPVASRPSYQKPQWRVDDGYVTFRGWIAADAAAEVGEVLFELPPPARPGRRETFRVSFKGEDRGIVVLPEGPCVLEAPLEANQWIPLVSLSYNSWQVERRTGGRAAGELEM